MGMVTREINSFARIRSINESTSEYSVDSKNQGQIYFYDAYTDLDSIPVYDMSNSAWEKIISDLLVSRKQAWEKLSEL